ncbi:MAG: hypothetical protein JRH17_17660 [Deltaproteobacteria bacterium]|nr:hypothetical protein [Deltaproteobacteria bacterium]
MEDGRERDSQLEQRRSGSAILTTLFLVLGMLGLAGLTVSVGQGYLARGQLQIAADAAASAAADRLRSGRTQLEARVLAQLVGEGTVALEDPIDMVDSDVVFGDFNHANNRFTPGGILHSPAVFVSAKRTSGSPDGPVDLLMGGLVGRSDFEVQASAVASTGCREIIFAIDGSASMQDEFAAALTMLIDFRDELVRVSRPGDKIGVTVYAGDALSMNEYSDNNGFFWSRPDPGQLSPIATDSADIDAFIGAMNSEPSMSCQPLTFPVANRSATRLPTLDDGSCVGKGDHHGIYQAMEMFDEVEDRCSSEGERLIVLITSRAPCPVWTRSLGGGWFGKWFGGSTQQAYEAADDAFAAGISIAPILIDRGQLGHQQCVSFLPTGFQFIQNMTRGFPQNALINPPQSNVDDLIRQINEVLFVRLVQ